MKSYFAKSSVYLLIAVLVHGYIFSPTIDKFNSERFMITYPNVLKYSIFYSPCTTDDLNIGTPANHELSIENKWKINDF